jgi:DNA-directed RNA polymerase specialized sigma24 family protein
MQHITFSGTPVGSNSQDGQNGPLSLDPPPAATLGDVLYADRAQDVLPERDWVALVNFIASGDQRALRQLYERTHRLAFTLIARITSSREAADDVTVELFRDIWRQAHTYQAGDESVLAWVMNLARAKALDWSRRDLERNSELLSPTSFLWGAVAKKIVSEFGVNPVMTAPHDWTEPEWKEVSPGISCKILAADEQHDRVSMLVHLEAGVDYPPHTHAGFEELHLLQGELCIDDRKLYPGDYNRAEPGTSDARVWSETGCTCVLVTSPSDTLR